MTTTVDIVNAALRRIGARAINTVDDSTPGGAIASDVYEIELEAALRAHTWNFSVIRNRLQRRTITPAYEYDYAYALPSDWMRTLAVYDNSAGDGQADYRQETIHTSDAATNGTFDTDTGWTKGTGWTIGSGVATHAAGSASDLSQTTTLAGSKLYRVAFLISGMTAGTLTPKFTGGVTVAGTARTESGYYASELTADAAGNTALVFSASASFDGSVDDVTCIRFDGFAAPSIISSASEIWLRYVRLVTNPDDMDPLFRQVLTLRLAKVFAFGLANSSTLHQLLDVDLGSAFRQAKSVDAIEDQAERFPVGSWVEARWGGSPDWGRWAR